MPSSGVQTCALDRKSTRLNSSHTLISYAVFCFKKKRLSPRERGVVAFLDAGLSERSRVRARDVTPPRVLPAGLTAPSLGLSLVIFFFFNDTATTEIYTLSLHDALPI